MLSVKPWNESITAPVIRMLTLTHALGWPGLVGWEAISRTFTWASSENQHAEMLFEEA